MRLRFLSWMPSSGGEFVQKSGDTMTGNVTVTSDVPGLYLNDTGGEAGLKRFVVYADDGRLSFGSLDDDGNFERILGYFNHGGNFVVQSAADANIYLDGATSGNVYFIDSGSSANNRISNIYSSDGTFIFAHLNDDYTVKTTSMVLRPDGGVQVTQWTTGTRPAAPTEGTLGYNTTTDELEVYKASAWHKITTTTV
jgi:hypothetical protein